MMYNIRCTLEAAHRPAGGKARHGKRVRIGACLFVGDMERMVRFYRDVLGLRTDWAGGHFAEFETAGGPTTLFMDSRREFARAIDQAYTPPRGINQSFEIALWLPTYADVDREYEHLSKLGVSFPCGAPVTFDFGIRNFYGTDPEGNLLEIGSMNTGRSD